MSAPDESAAGAGTVLVAIRAHEQALAARIERARKEASLRIAGATAEAAELEARAGRELEAELERDAALARVRASEEREERCKRASASIEAMRSQARREMPGAVNAMLAILLPEGEA
jgi:vacuolar-type H+-ATPase subunit H